jgi:hypothetical protein
VTCAAAVLQGVQESQVGAPTESSHDGSGRNEEESDMQRCGHLDHVHRVQPKTRGCEECLKMGDSWVHLRLCMECGHVGCCDDSKNTHATKHFHHTRHPIMRSVEPGEQWGWCFEDDLMLDFTDPAHPQAAE